MITLSRNVSAVVEGCCYAFPAAKAGYHDPGYYAKFACRLLGGSAAADASRLASNYLCAVAYGQHIQGREFEFIAAAPWNRLTFLNACKDVLQRVARQISLHTTCRPATVSRADAVYCLLCL